MEKRERRKKKVKKIGTFFVVNFTTTLIDFAIYAIVARFVGNSLLVVATISGGTVAAVAAYFLNKKITWRGTQTNKRGLFAFFGWNAGKVFIAKPLLTILYGFLTAVYRFLFSVSIFLRFPFDYDFVESTGIFIFVTLTTMILSYLIYDRLVFKKPEEN